MRNLTAAFTKIPFVQSNLLLRKELESLRTQLDAYQKGWPPGHFYSPLPSLSEIRQVENSVWPAPPKEIEGIALNEEKQLQLIHMLASYYSRQPWKDEAQPNLRFFFNNPNFSYGEAIFLFCLLAHLKPSRVIEVGCGYSSCALLDTNEWVLENKAACDFIEPYPDLLRSLIKPSDAGAVRVVEKKIQEVELSLFGELTEGDVLFIDSSHVSKVGSDVNHILFAVLPVLNSGVYIHFHDVYYPFEYPKEWVYQGRAWNEAYLLKAFLQYNSCFEVVLFNSFINHFHREFLREQMPLCAVNPGSSLWLRKK